MLVSMRISLHADEGQNTEGSVRVQCQRLQLEHFKNHFLEALVHDWLDLWVSTFFMSKLQARLGLGREKSVASLLESNVFVGA